MQSPYAVPRVNSRNWPMNAPWAPFCNLRGPFFKKWGPRKKRQRRPGLE